MVYMKKVFTLLMAALFVAASSLSAQTPAAAPAKKEVKKEMKKADKDMKKVQEHGSGNCGIWDWTRSLYPIRP